MLLLIPAGYSDPDKEWHFIREMSENENGVSNPWHGLSKETYLSDALPTMLAWSKGERLPDGYVPETFLFLTENGKIVGQFRIRHFLTDDLQTGTGHIGYFVHSACRGKGYAAEGLRQTLAIARNIVPETEFFLRTDRTNTASLHVMQKNGGKIVAEDTQKYYVRIPNPGKQGWPDRELAERLLIEGGQQNPGPWVNHSRIVAECAKQIASRCGMDSEKAYVLGLLHDIGRRFGKRHLGHVSDGYAYMMAMGYTNAAQICLSHSFNGKQIEDYVGNFDTTPEETQLIRNELKLCTFDDYDRLIQLCDAISGAEGVMDIVDRMSDVRRRYGTYDPQKWNTNLQLKALFEERMGLSIYDAVKDLPRQEI